MDRGKILDEAKRLTCGDRNAQYGPPGPQLGLAGEFYHMWLNAGGDRYSYAHNEAIHQVFVKLSRIAFGQQGKLDTYMDAAAYTAIAGELVTETEAEEILEQAKAEANKVPVAFD